MALIYDATGIGFYDTGTGALGLPKGSTAQRPANPLQGYMRFNTDLNVVEIFGNTANTMNANNWGILTTSTYSAQVLLVAAGGAGTGGGGGAGAAGSGGTSRPGGASGAGGIGVAYAITGTSTYYAGGGGGSQGGRSHYGGGGQGGGSGNGAGTPGLGGGGNAGHGGSGTVIIAYLGSQRATGGVVTTSGGYTIHTYTASGNYFS